MVPWVQTIWLKGHCSYSAHRRLDDIFAQCCELYNACLESWKGTYLWWKEHHPDEPLPPELNQSHYTSQTCSLCGEIGKRERQAFACTSCGARFQADFNASCNVRKVAYLILMLMAAAGPVVERRAATAREGSVTNKCS